MIISSAVVVETQSFYTVLPTVYLDKSEEIKLCFDKITIIIIQLIVIDNTYLQRKGLEQQRLNNDQFYISQTAFGKVVLS